jgi:regulator of RNase E activity RraA
MRGTQPIRPGQPRAVGRAFTLRFIPAREDLATTASWSSPRSTRAAIEEMPPGCIAVADAMGVTDAEYLAIFCVHGSSTAEWLVSSPMV